MAVRRITRHGNGAHAQGEARESREGTAPGGRPRSFLRLEDENGCAIDGVPLYRVQSFIGLIEGKGRYLGPKINLSSDLDQISGIGACHISHAAKLPLSPKQAVVVKLRNPVEMNRVDRDRPAL